MVERALGALRFAPNATLKISPFEAHHDREAISVLQNLTEKRSLQNLNWDRVSHQKSACLDTDEPREQSMPHPAKKTGTCARLGRRVRPGDHEPSH